MTEKSTTGILLARLLRANSIAGFITQNKEHMKQVPFHIYLSRLCAARDTVPERIIKKSGIARTYGHQLFKGYRMPSRDKVLQLAFGFEMGYDDAQALLKAARKTPLYVKVERDAAIIFALNRKLTVVETQEMLAELGFPILDRAVAQQI